MKKMALLLAALLLLSNLAGCGKSSKGKASVESVSMICGLSGVGQADRFAGVVSAQGETKVEKDDSRQVASVAVKTGDEVKKGQTLFTYDQTQAQLDLEKAQLELEQMKVPSAPSRRRKPVWNGTRATSRQISSCNTIWRSGRPRRPFWSSSTTSP